MLRLDWAISHQIVQLYLRGDRYVKFFIIKKNLLKYGI
jgi:hypothetical protein